MTMVKHCLNILCALFLLSFGFCVEAVGSETTPFVVVIDPGHGGKDVGCVGNLTNESTIVLDVAKRFGKLLNDSLPEVQVVYTRDDNRFITLQDRATIANKANGSVFISIHVNSVDRKNKNRASINGASVYTLGLHKSDNNLSVAMRENSVMELEDDYSENYQGFDPNSSESYIIFELNQNIHLQKSFELANALQHELVATGGRVDKGVRQAGFWVLWATSMPSVLVELDFICNPESEKFLNADDGRDRLAESLYNAFAAYYSRYKTDDHSPKIARSAVPTASSINSEPSAAPRPEKKTEVKKKSGEITYHVQLLSATKKLPKNDYEIKGIDNVNFFKDGKFYKYYCGNFSSREEAKKHLTKMKKRFPKAFIIKMRDGKLLK